VVQIFKDLVNSIPDDNNDRENINKTSPSKFMQKQLQLHPDFMEWLAAKVNQLNTYACNKMFGKPCPHP
jgi:hypothetical protein